MLHQPQIGTDIRKKGGSTPMTTNEARTESAAPQRLVDVHELARLLNVSPSWIYQRTRLGIEAIPVIHVGRHVRFDPEEVIAFLRAKEDHGNSNRAGVS